MSIKICAQTLIENSINFNTWLKENGPIENAWFQSRTEEGLFSAYPLTFMEGRLFRGQNKRHDRPFLSSLRRGVSSQFEALHEAPINDQSRIVERLVRQKWFLEDLKTHPLYRYAQEEQIYLNEVSIAQHYGMQTDYLDLTHSWDVAAFFATCRLKNGSREWEPVQDGIGVFYIVEPKLVNNSNFGKTESVTHHLFPRPFQQKAWVVQLPPIDSFEYWPNVKFFEFHHDKSVGEYFLEKFKGGSELFPADPLSVIADKILSSKELPIEYFENILDKYVDDQLWIKSRDVPEIKRHLMKKNTLVSGLREGRENIFTSFNNEIEASKKLFESHKFQVRLIKKR